MPNSQSTRRPEILALSSGKGGTGKTLIAACLGYSLTRAGHKVLMVDADPGTDGLSLFLLGPKGYQQIETFDPQNTFTGVLTGFQQSGDINFETRSIHRTGTNDHGVSYEALISGRNVYGDMSAPSSGLAVPDLDRNVFRRALAGFLDRLRSESIYDYVLVDTRGGFAFETTDICALADGFILVTEPDFTSFYQDRNLVKRISAAAEQLERAPVLRSIIVNKATEGNESTGQLDLTKLEASFRLELTKEFPILYSDIHPVPLDMEAVKAYKTQQIPYKSAPASAFSSSTLSAFSDILQVVTSRWSEQQVRGWNALVDEVSGATAQRNEALRRAAADEQSRASERHNLESRAAEQERTIEALRASLDDRSKLYEDTSRRSELSLSQRRRVVRLMGATIAVLLVVGTILGYWSLRRSLDTSGVPNDVAALTKLGWTVAIDLDGRIRLQTGTIQPPWRESSATLIRYKSIQISAPKAINLADIVALGSTDGELELDLANITDLKPLVIMKNLRTLDLSGAPVTDLAPLATLQNLTTLSVANSPVSDISPLNKLNRLAVLDLSATRVTDIAPLRGLVNLTDLSLANTQVTDISALSQLKNLTKLSLANTAIENISPLISHSGLRLLDLFSTHVKDICPLEGRGNNLRIIVGGATTPYSCESGHARS